MKLRSEKAKVVSVESVSHLEDMYIGAGKGGGGGGAEEALALPLQENLGAQNEFLPPMCPLKSKNLLIN